MAVDMWCVDDVFQENSKIDKKGLKIEMVRRKRLENRVDRQGVGNGVRLSVF
jgi:hypothetical protein